MVKVLVLVKNVSTVVIRRRRDISMLFGFGTSRHERMFKFLPYPHPYEPPTQAFDWFAREALPKIDSVFSSIFLLSNALDFPGVVKDWPREDLNSGGCTVGKYGYIIMECRSVCFSQIFDYYYRFF
ncbi:hypothetical protein CDAR_127701 [Caerostris darwini]|uniref:Uncharacterized protein n=1 Tax=Caerostris darwini TaxID=1538125 RepID=A0AAV4SUX1_9ARAC|nr:hypothetical protein CDAR_127701 [Caerostris darwini]